MKLGVIARADDRGLGNQTYEVCKALRPERVLIVDMGEHAGGFPLRPQRFLELGLHVSIVSHQEMHDRHTVFGWCNGLDVVYTAETFYEPMFPEWARQVGCATVCHLNPEFFKHWNEPEWPRPTEWWAPSSWLATHPHIPEDAYYVPMPAPTDVAPREPVPGSARFLHVAGKPAMGDRNGTRALLVALRYVTEPMRVTIRAQASSLPHPQRLSRSVSYRAIPQSAPDYRTMYANHDVLVMPRRYGGLCLPVIEAASAGLGVVMTNCSPNGEYPAELVATGHMEMLPTPLGEVPAYDVDPRALARHLDRLAEAQSARGALYARSLRWAADRSWDVQADEWRAHFTRARQAMT